MSRRGNCWDNAPQESFFGHFKDEANIKECETLEEVKREIKSYMTYYNHYRGTMEFKKDDRLYNTEIIFYKLPRLFLKCPLQRVHFRTEELSLEKETVYLLKRLLQIKEPYSTVNEIATDLQTALKAKE